MSKYRCPLCGATHKDQAERCRLCGQSMAPGAVATTVSRPAEPVRAARGTKGVVLIGAGLVMAVLGVAVVVGVVQANRQIRVAEDLVIGPADGWTVQTDEEGGFAVELPGTRTRESEVAAVTDDGRATAWTAELGDDAELKVAWGEVAPAYTDGAPVRPAAIRYLRDTTVARWLAGNRLDTTFVTVDEGGAGGLPAVTVRTTQARLALQGREAYSRATFALDGTRLYVLQVVTIYRDAPQLDRMVASFRPGATAS